MRALSRIGKRMPIGPRGSARGDIGVTLQLILDVVYCIRTCLVALHGAEFLMGSSPQLTRGAWSREDEILISPDVNNDLDKHVVRGGSSHWSDSGSSVSDIGTLPTSRGLTLS